MRTNEDGKKSKTLSLKRLASRTWTKSITRSSTAATLVEVPPLPNHANPETRISNDYVHPASIPETSSPNPPPRQSYKSGLFPLYIPPIEGNCPVDIIALHGINGDAYSTFTGTSSQNLWLRDFLPRSFPGARIYTFGYDARVLFSLATGDISTFANNLLEDVCGVRVERGEKRRPIIWIVHSMGGLVVKKALTIASNDPTRYGDIHSSTTSILFMATPHRGSDHAALFSGIAEIANWPLAGTLSRFKGKVRDDLIRGLEKDSPAIRKIAEDFRKLGGLKFFSFVEMNRTKPLSRKVVDEETGTMGVDGERVFYMDGEDHKSIVRFESAESPSYRKVLAVLREAVGDAVTPYLAKRALEDEPCLGTLFFPTMTHRRASTSTAHPKHAHGSWVIQYLKNGTAHLVLYQRSAVARDIILEAYEEKGYGFGEVWNWLASEVEGLLKAVVKKVAETKELTIFVDALDEAVDANGEKAAPWLLQFFYELNEIAIPEEGCLGGVKICISCRHYPVVGSFGPGTVIRMEKENERDVRNFIHDKLRNGVPGWDQAAVKARQGLVDGIARKADGVFQWASLRVPKIVQSLNDGDASLEEINDMIAGESNELFPLYESIFGNDIPVRLRKRALLFLQWVCFAERPMSLMELRFAMACDDEDLAWPRDCCEASEYFVKSDTQMQKLTKSLSGGLVEVRSHETGTRIQFVHETVNEFCHSRGLQLLASKAVIRPALHASNILGQSQSRLTRSCLNYLRMEYVMDETGQWLDGDECFPPFLEYATKYWTLHAEKAEKHGVSQENIVEILQSPAGIFEIWLKVVEKKKYYNVKISTWNVSLLHVAAAYNLRSVARALLQRGVPVGVRDDGDLTALHVAAEQGHEGMVVLLLNAEAEVNAKCRSQQSTPLEVAAVNGHYSIAKLLLERGTDLKDMSIYANVLHAAAAKGTLSLVRYLIENGASVNVENRNHEAAIAVAAGRGHERVVKLLLESGADVDAGKNGLMGGTALQRAAASRGHDSICHLLLDAGADINARNGGDYAFALQAAAHGCNYSTVRLLLGRNADINAVGGYYGTALQAAAAKPDNEEIIKLLIDHGADLNIQGGYHGTAFLAAAASHSEANVHTLIERGADTNIEGGYNGNALSAAARSSEMSLVKFFVNRGADVNKRGGEHGTALHASIMNSQSIPEFLLEKGADMNAVDGSRDNFGPILNAAAYWGREYIVRKLLARGVATSCNESYMCALERATSGDSVNIIKMLLDHGADVNCHGRGMRAGPLHSAAYHGKVQVAELLLDRGADINAYLPNGGTPLQLAVSDNHKPVVELLLDRGADPNLGDVSPCCLEAAQGNKTITKLLLKRGAKQMPDREYRFLGGSGGIIDRLSSQTSPESLE
ncbi:Ankyrin repeat domain-containing protein [Lachnellula willkommii]|uniref:Ankyrin repeat domain-containing protein n=1 Tax=Lachnellula willkommii TaxID=215461 RepID=A0A559MGU9_9HELO|nr:Ankyrin repeat domain-containing protein [Lachnellula willkommii]